MGDENQPNNQELWNSLKHLWQRVVVARLERLWNSDYSKRLRDYITMVGNALPLLLLWLAIPTLLFAVLAWVQANYLLDEVESAAFETVEVPFTGTDGRGVKLVISPPDRGRIDLDDESRIPLAIWLLYDPAVPAVPTPTPTPAPDTTQTDTSGDATAEPRYIVTLASPSSNVKFTDQDELPGYGQFTLTPAWDSRTPVVIYAGPINADGAAIELQAQVYDMQHQPQLNTPATWDINVESAGSARLRYLVSQFVNAGAIVGLIGGLVGFGMQQWSQLAEEDRVRERRESERQEEEDARIKETERHLRELDRLLEPQHLSRGARQYMAWLDAANTEGSLWRHEDSRAMLQELWQQKAPENLQRVVELRIRDEQDDLPDPAEESEEWLEEQEGYLLWGYTTLDDEWKQNISDILLNDLGRVLPDAELTRQWRAILKPWPQIQLWPPPRFFSSPAVAEGVRLLRSEGRLLPDSEREVNPFSTAPAQMDTQLIATRVELPHLRQTIEAEPCVVFGVPGIGKTALALLAAHECLQGHLAFPVYYPTVLAAGVDRNAHLQHLARVITQTYLHYWVSLPNAFLDQQSHVRACFAPLMGRYAGTGKALLLRLEQAGLTRVGSGAVMWDIIEELMADLLLDEALGDRELMALLAQARPEIYGHVFVLVDVANDDVGDDPERAAYQLRPLLHLMPELAHMGIHLKLLLPERLRDLLGAETQPFRTVTIAWERGDIKTLLEQRLTHAGLDKLATLCDPYDIIRPDPEFMLIEKVHEQAHATPASLFALGSRLISCIAAHPKEPYITYADLQTVLGRPTGDRNSE